MAFPLVLPQRLRYRWPRWPHGNAQVLEEHRAQDGFARCIGLPDRYASSPAPREAALRVQHLRDVLRRSALQILLPDSARQGAGTRIHDQEATLPSASLA